MFVASTVIRIIDCITNDGDDVGKPCVFPFIYQSTQTGLTQTYYACTKQDDSKNWCATEVDSNGVRVYGKWGYCSPNCEVYK